MFRCQAFPMYFFDRFAYMETWNDRLAQARKDRKLTKTALAKAVGVSQPTVTDWESGENKPKGDNLLALCRVLSVTPEWLTKGQSSLAPAPAPATPQPQLSADEQTLLAIYRGLSPAARANAITEMEVLQVRDKRAGATAPERQPAPPKDPPSDLCRDRRAQ